MKKLVGLIIILIAGYSLAIAGYMFIITPHLWWKVFIVVLMSLIIYRLVDIVKYIEIYRWI